MTGDRVSHVQYYLVDVEAFVRPIAVVPDLGGPPNAYFVLKSREEWRQDFIKWLDSPHYLDVYEESSDEENLDNNENYDAETTSSSEDAQDSDPSIED